MNVTLGPITAQHADASVRRVAVEQLGKVLDEGSLDASDREAFRASVAALLQDDDREVLAG